MIHVTFLFVSCLSSIRRHDVLTSRCYAASILSNLTHQARMVSFYYPLKTAFSMSNTEVILIDPHLLINREQKCSVGRRLNAFL